MLPLAASQGEGGRRQPPPPFTEGRGRSAAPGLARANHLGPHHTPTLPTRLPHKGYLINGYPERIPMRDRIISSRLHLRIKPQWRRCLSSFWLRFEVPVRETRPPIPYVLRMVLRTR